MRKPVLAVLAVMFLVMSGARSEAQTTTVPIGAPGDTSRTSTLTATVSEQATVSVPSNVTFAVTNINNSTNSGAQPVTVTGIVTDSATKRLRISLKANAASFTSPGGTPTWSASDVAWTSTWTNATAANNTLNSASFSSVAECTADAVACSTADLVLTLGAKTTVKRAGDHTLQVTWKFESF